MAIRELIKNKNFIVGFIIGFTLTLGRVYISVLEKLLRPIFGFWNSIWPSGVILEVVPLYISGLVIFLVIWLLFLRNNNSLVKSIKLFSLGFISSFLIFLLLTVIAISQFKFAQ